MRQMILTAQRKVRNTLHGLPDFCTGAHSSLMISLDLSSPPRRFIPSDAMATALHL